MRGSQVKGGVPGPGATKVGMMIGGGEAVDLVSCFLPVGVTVLFWCCGLGVVFVSMLSCEGARSCKGRLF